MTRNKEYGRAVQERKMTRMSSLVLAIFSIVLLALPALAVMGLDAVRTEDMNRYIDESGDMTTATKVDYDRKEEATDYDSPCYQYFGTTKTNGSATVAGGGSGTFFTVTLLKGTETEATGASSYRMVAINTGLTIAEVKVMGVDEIKCQVAWSTAVDNLDCRLQIVDKDGDWMPYDGSTNHKEIDYAAAGWRNFTLDVDILAVNTAATNHDPDTTYLVIMFVQKGAQTNYLVTADVGSMLFRVESDYDETSTAGFSRNYQTTMIMFTSGIMIIGGSLLATPMINLPHSVKRQGGGLAS